MSWLDHLKATKAAMMTRFATRRGIVRIGGTMREMTPEELAQFDAAFDQFDKSFDALNEAFRRANQ